MLAERKLRMQRSDQHAKMLLKKGKELEETACKAKAEKKAEEEASFQASPAEQVSPSSPPLPPIQMSSSVPPPT